VLQEKLDNTPLYHELQVMLNDLELLISVSRNHDEVQCLLKQNSDHLRSALAKPDTLENLQGLPKLVENIHCELLPEGFVNQKVFTQNRDSVVIRKKLEKLTEELPRFLGNEQKFQKTNNFFVRIYLWFSSTGNSSWSATKHCQR
jgi:hypothetical protein